MSVSVAPQLESGTPGPLGTSLAPHVAEALLVQIRVDTSLYTLEALFRTCYKFTDRCYLWLERADGDNVTVHARPRAGGDVCDCVGSFRNELIDQRLRVDLARETRTIREWIVAQAFVEADLDVPAN